ncbi:MAG: IS3 family transposase [Culicoidibacterales bacterium]
MQLSRSTFYYHLNRTISVETRKLINEIKAIFEEHKGRCGYRLLILELKNRDFLVNHKRVKRIMSELKLYGR